MRCVTLGYVVMSFSNNSPLDQVMRTTWVCDIMLLPNIAEWKRWLTTVQAGYTTFHRSMFGDAVNAGSFSMLYLNTYPWSSVKTWRKRSMFCLPDHMPSSVQSLSSIWLFVTPWPATCQASLSITNSQNLLKLKSIELVMPSNLLILCHPLHLSP